MRGAISAHWAFPATGCTRRRRLEPASRATTADRRRASRNCCAAMCAGQRIQSGGMFQRIQRGEGGKVGLIRRPLPPPSSPTLCLAGPQHRCITVTILLNVTQTSGTIIISCPATLVNTFLSTSICSSSTNRPKWQSVGATRDALYIRSIIVKILKVRNINICKNI